MNTKPNDTSSEVWAARKAILAGMDGDTRVRAAIDLSEAVREIQIQGVLDRNPTWQRSDAIRHMVRKHAGVELESRT